MPAPRKQPHSQSELAKLAGVSVKTIREWKKSEGLDLSDVKAVMLRAGKVERDNPTDGGESYTEARRRRAIADANRAEIIARRESKSVVERAAVEQAFVLIVSEFRARLLSMRGDLIHQLHGLPEAGIYRVLDDAFRDLLTDIAERNPVKKTKP